jgi:hypothetical protein
MKWSSCTAKWRSGATLRCAHRAGVDELLGLDDRGPVLRLLRYHEDLAAWARTSKSFSRHPVYFVWKTANELITGWYQNDFNVRG